MSIYDKKEYVKGLDFLKAASNRVVEYGVPNAAVPSVEKNLPFGTDADKNDTVLDLAGKRHNAAPKGRDGGQMKAYINADPIPEGFVMPSFGAKRGGATSAPPMIREAPFGVGGAYAVDHPEFDRTLHMRNAKHKHGMKFGAMKEKELAFVPDRELTHQIYAENRGLRKQNDIAFRGGAGDILGHDGLALEVKNFSDVEKVGDNKYDRRTYRRNHRKYIAISAHANNRSKNMKRALIHSDNPMAILTGGA